MKSRYNIKHIVLLFFLLLCSSAMWAQQEIYSYSVEDSISRCPSEMDMEQYFTSPKFDYEHTKQSTSWWYYILNALSYLFNAVSTISPVVIALLIIIAAIVVVLIALNIGGFNLNLSLLRPKEHKLIQYSEIENIDNTDLKAMEQLYIKHGAYREAIRVQYLILLQLLNKAGAIKWHPKKTNSDYLNEMRKNSLYKPFKDATLNYEYCWYGHFSVDEQLFTKLNNQYQSITKQVIQ